MGEVRRETLPPYVLWLDPGKTTGWAALHTDGDRPLFKAGEGDFLEVCGIIDSYCEYYHESLLVGYESYLGTGGTPRFAHEMIGVARYLAMSRGIEITEAPAGSRTIVTIPVLKALGCHRLGQGHANDASRHLIAWLMREMLLQEHLKPVFTSLLP